MCVMSMVMDHRYDEWYRRLHQPVLPNIRPPWNPYDQIPFPQQPPYVNTPSPPTITQQEIDEFRRLLEKAKKYDEEHNQPDCELDEKKQKLKKLAEELGVKIDFL